VRVQNCEMHAHPVHIPGGGAKPNHVSATALYQPLRVPFGYWFFPQGVSSEDNQGVEKNILFTETKKPLALEHGRRLLLIRHYGRNGARAPHPCPLSGGPEPGEIFYRKSLR